MEVAISSSQLQSSVSSSSVSSTPFSSRGGLLKSFFHPTVGSLPWEIVLSEVLQPGSFRSPLTILPWVPLRELPANLFQCALLPPQGQRFYWGSTSVWASHQVTAFFRHPFALTWDPPWAANGYLLPHGLPWTAEGQSVSPWSSPHQGSLSSGTWSTFSPFCFTVLGVCRFVIFTLSSGCSFFFNF